LKYGLQEHEAKVTNITARRDNRPKYGPGVMFSGVWNNFLGVARFQKDLTVLRGTRDPAMAAANVVGSGLRTLITLIGSAGE